MGGTVPPKKAQGGRRQLAVPLPRVCCLLWGTELFTLGACGGPGVPAHQHMLASQPCFLNHVTGLGHFWGMEDLLQKHLGVQECHVPNPALCPEPRLHIVLHPGPGVLQESVDCGWVGGCDGGGWGRRAVA